MSKYGRVAENRRFSGLRPFLLTCAMSQYVSEYCWRA